MTTPAVMIQKELTDWIHQQLEQEEESATCFLAGCDPAVIVEELEEDLIDTLGCNICGQRHTQWD